MQREEKLLSAIAHLMALIPIWGIAANGFLWHYFKDRNKSIVFHSKQAITFQVLFIFFCVFSLGVKLFCWFLIYINHDIGNFFMGLNNFMIKIALVAYIFLCCFAAWSTFQGGNYEYPIIGDKLKEKE